MFSIQDIRSNWTAREWVNCFLVALVFVMPISSTAKSIFLGLVVATILLSPDYRQSLADIWSTQWCKASVLLFGIALLACIGGLASASEKWLVLEKYSKLLYLPILVVGFQDKRVRPLAIYAFLFAMFITSALSVCKYSGIIQSASIDQDYVFRNHIMTGIMMSFATYLCGLLFFQKQGMARVLCVLLGLLYTFQIFVISTGRTGYFIYFLLMGLLMMHLLTKRQAIAGLIAVCALFMMGYQLSPTMHAGLNQIVSEWQHFEENKNTSIGYRMQFHDYADDLFKRHPIVGNGTGSFTAAFRMEKPVPSWDRRLLEPHSQYWMIAAEFGVIGLMGLCVLLGSLFFASFQLQAMRPIAIAILMILCVGNLTDSLLFYSGSGYFFILFLALCLGEKAST